MTLQDDTTNTDLRIILNFLWLRSHRAIIKYVCIVRYHQEDHGVEYIGHMVKCI